MKPEAALVGLLLAACSGEPRAAKLVSVPSAPDATASTVELESLTVEEPRRLGKGHAMAWTEGTIAIADGPDMVLVDETTLVERERATRTATGSAEGGGRKAVGLRASPITLVRSRRPDVMGRLVRDPGRRAAQ